MSPTPLPVHQLLLASGIEFIEQAVADFQNENYKFSVIHFGSGIEIILKARICQEDYRLIISDEEQQSISESEFRKGYCHTISTGACKKIIQRDLKITLPNKGKNWDKLTRFRNRAIHFVLEGVDDQLRLLHYKGFYDLKTFIRGQRLPFKPFKERLKILDNALGALVKKRFAPHINSLYLLLEDKMNLVQRQLKLTQEVYRSAADRYFSLTEKAPRTTLDKVAKASRLSPKDNTHNHRIYRRYGDELSRIYSTSEFVSTAFILKSDRTSSDLDFIEFQLAYRWPRIHYYAAGLSWATPSITELNQTPIHWPSKEKRSEITTFLTAISQRITNLKRQQELLGYYHEGLRQRSFT